MSELTPPDDDRLTAALGRIGGVTREFLPAKGTLYTWIGLYVAGIVVGVGIVGFLVANEISVQTTGEHLIPGDNSKKDIAGTIIGCILGLKAVVFGSLFLRAKLHDLTGRVYAGPDGFVVYRGTRKPPEVYTWGAIASMHQDPVDAVKYATKDGPPMKRDTSFCIRRRDGEIFGFWVDSLRDHRAFAKYLYAQAQARGIPWVFGPPQ